MFSSIYGASWNKEFVWMTSSSTDRTELEKIFTALVNQTKDYLLFTVD